MLFLMMGGQCLDVGVDGVGRSAIATVVFYLPSRALSLHSKLIVIWVLVEYFLKLGVVIGIR